MDDSKVADKKKSSTNYRGDDFNKYLCKAKYSRVPL